MKAQSGITFLILFIAMILATAVTVSVYLTTSNKLEQGALSVGRETEQRISRGLEIIEVIARGNKTTGEMYGFNLLVRPLAASDALLIESIIVRFSSPTGGFTADVQDVNATNFEDSTSPALTGDVTWNGYNVDPDGGRNDVFSYGNSTTLGYPAYAGNNILILETDDDGTQIVDTTAAGLTNNGVRRAILNTTTDVIYGYYSIGASDNRLHVTNANESCVWQQQIRNSKFCWYSINSDGDRYLETDEIFEFQYRLSQPYYLNQGDSFDVEVLTARGHIHPVKVQLPQIIIFDEFTAWP